jgi:hypothetical protein
MLQDKQDTLSEDPPQSMKMQEGNSESETSTERGLLSPKRSHNTLGSTAAISFQPRVLNLLALFSRDTQVVSAERLRFSPFSSSPGGPRPLLQGPCHTSAS